VLAIIVAVTSSGTGQTEAPAPAEDPSDATATEPAQAEPDMTEGEPGDPAPAPDPAPAAAPEPVDLPALHPDVDQLPAAIVTFTTADPAAGDPATDDPAEASVVEVAVRVAATPQTRQRGLMEVPALPDGVGMLFIFDAPRTGGFWMWNTLVPLDIGFVGEDGTLHTILAMDPCEADQPRDCPTYAPERPYLTAVEVPQGWFAANGVAPGAEVTWSAPVP